MLVNEPDETNQAQSQILHPGTRALFSFWESMRGENSAPTRSALDLKRVGDLLPNLMIVEPDPGGHGFRWRLAGTAICSLYQRELTGGDVLSGLDKFEAHVVGRFLTGVVRNLQPCLLRFRLFTDLQQIIGAEFLGMPLQAANGDIQIFGGVFPFRNMQALGHRAITGMVLSAARSIWIEKVPGDRLMRRLGDVNRSFTPPFRVIKGGRGS